MLIPKVEDARSVPECMTDPSEALYMVVRLALARSRFNSRSLIGLGRWEGSVHVRHRHGVFKG